MELGTLKKIDLRDIWASEAQDFTPWLARQENLNLLGETLGLELELQGQEVSVGPFRADILCSDLANGTNVLIENQLERTNHTHLGQLMAYAAGLQSVTIVWVAAKFQEDHRAAMDWLNEITKDEFQFFGLEVELWKIGNSAAAPKFNLVSKPNDWSRSVAKNSKSTEPTGRLATYERYWSGFVKHLEQIGSNVRPQKPRPQHWMHFSVGRSGFLLMARLSSQKNEIGVGFETYDEGKEYFDALLEMREEIESGLGFSLDWDRLDGKKMSRIGIQKKADVSSEDDWIDSFKWQEQRLSKLNEVFRPIIKDL
jgi:hypothetical protein